MSLAISSDAATGCYGGWAAYGGAEAAVDLSYATLANKEPHLDTEMHRQAVLADTSRLRQPQEVARALAPLFSLEARYPTRSRLRLLDTASGLGHGGHRIMDTQLLDLGLAVPQATAPAEYRGLTRDGVKLLILDHFARTAENASVHDLSHFLEPGDMIVVNDSAMIGARLHASCSAGRLVLHLAADLGPGLALVERRDPAGEPDWAPFAAGDRIVLTDREGWELSRGTVAGRFQPQSRRWLANTQDPWYQVAAVSGSPVRYGYVGRPYPLSDYHSVFGCRPSSSEMPSASRPFTLSLVAALRRMGMEFGSLTLHTSLSSHEVATSWEEHPVIPEWFQVPELTARRVNATRRAGHSVIALGTTVARALETCYDANKGAVAPRSGWTRHLITPEHPPRAVTGLITGLHDNFTSHLALLYAFTGPDFLKAAYRDAPSWGYLWHEFGDLCLIHSRYNNREEALQAR